MDRLNDLEINRGVRKILVRHWIDLGRISVRTTAGVCTISGELGRLPKVEPPLCSSMVTGMINEIRRLPGVRRIQSNLKNWEDRNGVWKQTTSGPTDFHAQVQKQKESGVYDLTAIENESLSDLK